MRTICSIPDAISMSVYVNFLLFSPQLATRLLAHKIQSPQEWEAMQALMVIDHPSNHLLKGRPVCCAGIKLCVKACLY